MNSITEVLEMHARGLTLSDFMQEVIRRGLDACQESYKNNEMKRNGAVAGFEACRVDSLDELREVLRKAREQKQGKFEQDDHWYYRCYEAEVEWVCNVVSSLFYLLNSDLKLVTPTARGVMMASEVCDALKSRG